MQVLQYRDPSITNQDEVAKREAAYASYLLELDEVQRHAKRRSKEGSDERDSSSSSEEEEAHAAKKNGDESDDLDRDLHIRH